MLGEQRNKYPVYVLSKGRSNTCLTARMLNDDHVDFYLVVEQPEAEQYQNHFPANKVLILPPESSGRGAIPVRNWIWEHSKQAGFKRHWVLDDNIRCVYRWYKGKRIPASSMIAMKVIEDYTDRYTNIAISGMNYSSFAIDKMPPLNVNVHVYSYMLIDNDLPFRWRGEWNSDTDLCLQALHVNMCTVSFNLFLAGKVRTMSMKGGNTDRYQGDGRTKMAMALYNQWPMVVKVYRRFGRWQHYINWQQFKTRLQRDPNFDWDSLPKVNDYGIKLVQKKQIKSKQIKNIFREFNE